MLTSTKDPVVFDRLITEHGAPSIVTADDAPDYLAQEGISHGYRVNHNCTAAAGSVFGIHNESINIWTHFIAMWAFLAWFVFIFVDTSASHATNDDLAIIIVYASGLLLSLLCSTILHVFNCYTRTYKEALCRLDHFGILLLLLASDLPMVYFGLSCWPSTRRVYLVILPIIVVLAMGIILSDWMQNDRNIKHRLFVFISVVSFGIIHMAHECHLRGGFSTADGRRVFFFWLIVSLMYGIGITFYATHFPEKYIKSKRLSFFGASHQLWHFFTIFGGALHVYSMLIYLEMSHKCYLIHS
jgi:adiponectin receptor